MTSAAWLSIEDGSRTRISIGYTNEIDIPKEVLEKYLELW